MPFMGPVPFMGPGMDIGTFTAKAYATVFFGSIWKKRITTAGFKSIFAGIEKCPHFPRRNEDFDKFCTFLNLDKNAIDEALMQEKFSKGFDVWNLGCRRSLCSAACRS